MRRPDGGGSTGANAAAELDVLDSSRSGANGATATDRWDAGGAAEALRDRCVTGEQEALFHKIGT